MPVDNRFMRLVLLSASLLLLLHLTGGCIYNNREEPFYPVPQVVHEAAIIPFQVTVLNPLKNPIPGAQVSVQTKQLFWGAETMHTDDHGRIRVGVVQGSRMVINVFADGYDPWTLTMTKASDLPEELLVHPVPDTVPTQVVGDWITNGH